MTVQDWIIAGLRTAVQAGIGAALIYFTDRFGIVIDEAAFALAADAFIIGAVTSALRLAEGRFPYLSRILSLGVTSGTASYPNRQA